MTLCGYEWTLPSEEGLGGNKVVNPALPALDLGMEWLPKLLERAVLNSVL